MTDFMLEVRSANIKDGNKTYCFDFTVYFELVNPSDDIYRPDGADAFDKGQDEINFTFAIVRNGLQKEGDEGHVWTGVSWQDHHLLAELALDWCRDNPDMHMAAFKQAKGYY